MLNSVRRRNKLIQIVLFVLVFPAFVLVGVSSFSGFTGKEILAESGDVSVSSAEFDQQLKNALDQARGGNTKADTSALDTASLRSAVLDSLLARKLYGVAASSAHMAVTPTQLREALRTNPIVAPYLDAQGRLLADKEAEYENAVKLYGMDIASFENNVKAQVPLTQIDQVFSTSYFTNATQPFLQRLLETREIQILPFSTGSQVAAITVSDAQAQDWYNTHKAVFTVPENLDVEFLVMDALALGQSDAAPTEAQLQSFFDKNVSRFGGNVSREASHILVASNASASAEQQAAARKKAEALRADLLKNPSRFAEIAQQSSDDPGSKSAGGKLGPITPGTMVKPFEDATFALTTVGAISPVVQTEFGFHIIKLDKIDGKQPTLADVHTAVLRAYQEELGQQRFTEQSENFRNAVHEAENNLATVAKNFKLTLQTAQQIARQPQANRGSGLDPAFTDKAVLAALFAPDSVHNKLNTEVLQVGAQRLIAARVTQHHTARTPPFGEVVEAARARLRQSLAAQAALAAAKAKLATLKANVQDSSGFEAPIKISRMTPPPTLARAVVDAAMRTPTAQMPALALADLQADGAAIVRVLSVGQSAESAQASQSWSQQVQQAHSLSERLAFIQDLKARAKVKILMPEKLQPSAAAAP